MQMNEGYMKNEKMKPVHNIQIDTESFHKRVSTHKDQ